MTDKAEAKCAQAPRHESILNAAAFLSKHAEHDLIFDDPHGLRGVFAWCRTCSHSIHSPFPTQGCVECGESEAAHLETDAAYPYPKGIIDHPFIAPTDVSAEGVRQRCAIQPCEDHPIHRYADAGAYLTALLNDVERRVDGGTMYLLSVGTIYHLRAAYSRFANSERPTAQPTSTHIVSTDTPKLEEWEEQAIRNGYGALNRLTKLANHGVLAEPMSRADAMDLINWITAKVGALQRAIRSTDTQSNVADECCIDETAHAPREEGDGDALYLRCRKHQRRERFAEDYYSDTPHDHIASNVAILHKADCLGGVLACCIAAGVTAGWACRGKDTSQPVSVDVEALSPFLKHLSGCDHWDPDGICNCGLADILNKSINEKGCAHVCPSEIIRAFMKRAIARPDGSLSDAIDAELASMKEKEKR